MKRPTESTEWDHPLPTDIVATTASEHDLPASPLHEFLEMLDRAWTSHLPSLELVPGHSHREGVEVTRTDGQYVVDGCPICTHCAITAIHPDDAPRIMEMLQMHDISSDEAVAAAEAVYAAAAEKLDVTDYEYPVVVSAPARGPDRE